MSKTRVYNGAVWLDSTHAFQQTEKKLTPDQMFRGFFLDLIPSSIRVELTEVHDFKYAHVIVFPIATFDQLLQAMKWVTDRSLLNKPIVFSYLRENIDPHEEWPLAVASWDLKNCTLLVNGHHPQHFGMLPVIAVDTFLFNELPSAHKKPPVDVAPITIFAGSMLDRFERAYLIARCDMRGLSDTIFATYKWDNTIRDHVYKMARQHPKGSDVVTAIDNGVFKQSLVDGDGHLIDNADDLYTKRWEFAITPQLQCSKLNVALETRPWSPTLTEKSYKPIRAGVPHVWMAHRHVAPWLVSQGYRLYPSIDYTFDDQPTVFDRIDELVDRVLVSVADGLDPRDPEIAKHNQDAIKANTHLWQEFPPDELCRALLPNRQIREVGS